MPVKPSVARVEEWKRRLTAYERIHRELAGQLAELGFMHEGTVVQQRLTCGKSACACHSDPERRHGPYFYWTAKVKGRTVSRLLTKVQAELYEEWIRNRRRFREIQRKMLALSKKAAPVAVRIRQAGPGSSESG
jgi:hypothetical protein